MSRGRPWILAVGIPVLLLYGTLAVAQLRCARALMEFKRLQKAYPPDSFQRAPAEVQHRKSEALALAERMAPDNPEVAFQTALFHLVRAETESLQPEGSTESSARGPDPRLVGSLKEGLKWIDRAIALNPGYAEYPFVKATILQNLEGTLETAGSSDTRGRVSALLRLSHRLDPYRPALHYRIGSFWIALGERVEARDALAVALTDSFRYARPVFDLLWSSVEDAADLQDFVGDRPLSRALLGDFLWMHGYRKEAQEQFQHVEAAKAFDYLTGEALIVHYLREYQGDSARRVIARMENSDPHLSLFYRSRLQYFQGRSFFLEKRFVEAIGAYERSLALDPSVIQSHLELAEAYLEEGQPQKAIARWHYVLSRGISVPRDVAGPGDIHFGLGRAYEALGDRDRALAEYLRASSEDPANVDFSRKASEITKGL